MDLNQLISASIADSKASLWPAFAPELVLCATIFLMLIVRTFRIGRWVHGFWLTVAGAGIGLYYATLTASETMGRTELFTGMLVHDPFAVYIRAVLMLFVVLFAFFTRISGIPDKHDSVDFYTLVLGSTLGMCLMASANHLLIVFLAVEMASVPSYALAAMLKGRRKSSEAALKYAVFGAGAAGVMLYGISLLAGLLGSCHLPTLAAELAQQLPAMENEQKMVLVLGGLMVMVGLAFKLSAVPFHFWCPDVFEGASAEVDAFLSVASKAAALALLVRVALGFGLVPQTPETTQEIQVATAVERVKEHDQESLFAVADHASIASGRELLADRQEQSLSEDQLFVVEVLEDQAINGGSPAALSSLASARTFAALLIAIVSVITCTFGNLAAYGQTNIKRLLAYSTIAHAGYMMMPVPAALALADRDAAGAQRAIAAIAIYIAIYLFMNLGAFAVVAFLRNWIRSEEIADYAGIVRRHPLLVICFAIILFSLVGLPPLAGFIGKFAIFASLVDGYRISGQTYLMVLLVVGGLNTVVSLFYYLRVIKVMAMEPESDRVATIEFSTYSVPGFYLFLVTLPLVVLFLSWNVLNEWTLAAANHLF